MISCLECLREEGRQTLLAHELFKPEELKALVAAIISTTSAGTRRLTLATKQEESDMISTMIEHSMTAFNKVLLAFPPPMRELYLGEIRRHGIKPRESVCSHAPAPNVNEGHI